jgi:hypothetical protein
LKYYPRDAKRITENEDINTSISPPVLYPAEDVMVYWQMPSTEKSDPSGRTWLSRYSNIYKQNIGSLAET